MHINFEIFELVRRICILMLSVENLQSNASKTGRIVGGVNASDGEFPFIASLQYKQRHFCGASIINKNYVMSAAHCLCLEDGSLRIPIEEITVRYGAVDIESNKTSVVKLEAVTCHEYYYHHKGYTLNDIALIELDANIPAKKFKPVVLASEHYYDTSKNTESVAIGWGLSHTDDKKIMQFLQKVNFLVYRNSICRRTMFGRLKPMYHICAGWPENGKGTCRGDSGGPLLINNVQVGITAFGEFKCETSDEDRPQVFTRVSAYIDWIKERAEDIEINKCSLRHPMKIIIFIWFSTCLVFL